MTQLPPEVLLPILERTGYRGYARTTLIPQLREFSEEYLPIRLDRLASYRQSEQYYSPELAARQAFADGEYDISDEIIRDHPRILNWLLRDSVLGNNVDQFNYVLSRNELYQTVPSRYRSLCRSARRLR